MTDKKYDVCCDRCWVFKQHLNSTVGCGILQVSGNHNLPEPEVGTQHQQSHQKGPAEDVLPAPDQEVQPASGAADPVLHSSH